MQFGAFFKRFLRGVAANARPPFQHKYWSLIRLTIFLTVDTICLALAYYGAFFIRLEDWTLGRYFNTFLTTLPFLLASNLVIFKWGGIYRQVWRFANSNSAILILRCVILGSVLSALTIYMFYPGTPPPRSVPVIFFLLASLFVGVSKFSWRAWAEYTKPIDKKAKEVCLVYGAGAAGELFARHMRANIKFPFHIACFIDDDRNKFGRTIHGIKIEGSREDIGALCQKYRAKSIVLAMPSLPGKDVRDIVQECRKLGVMPLVMPELSTTLSDHIISPRTVDIKDLLRRMPASTDKDHIRKFIQGKTILVTGAGGSIGSELCRQICESNPKRIVLVDSCEFNLFKIEGELVARFPNVERHTKLVNVCDEVQMKKVFNDFRPYCVMHAAAYKHVPMVEKNVVAGILNNVQGTKTTAECAIESGTEYFILISTDKAVNPTNVMGASKRCCELLLQEFNRRGTHQCHFSAVRFGNVLGSSGSVIPQFLEQIQNGGPVTITHPDITRYFMLTSEAVGLVLHAASKSKGGEIFVLNMGEPVKIYDMAKHLIELAGKVPGKDIEIIVTGLRPGEKLYEELVLEGTEQTELHEDIYVLRPNPSKREENTFQNIEEIIAAAYRCDENLAVSLLRNLIAFDARPKTSRDIGSKESVLGGHVH